MADNSQIKNLTGNAPIVPTTAATPAAAKPTDGKKPTDGLGQAEFLTLLVNQLKNQDPLNPMDSQQFAVQLAQFSSLEQLIGINKKLDTSAVGGGSAGSMASFLGNEVVLKDKDFTVENGNGENLLVDIPQGTQSVRVDFMDQTGQVVGQHAIDAHEPGKQALHINGLNLADGNYNVRVVSVDAGGRFVDLPSKISGTVDGFVLEPEPRLLVGGKEVALADVTEVHKG